MKIAMNQDPDGQLDRRGMTLVEMMISITIFAVVLGVVMGFMTTSGRSYSATREKVQYQQSVRAVISLLTKEIRSTGCDPANVGFDRFVLADDNALRCQMDLNGDSDVTDVTPDESVTYNFDPATGELSRDNGTGAIVILRGVTNVTFTYLRRCRRSPERPAAPERHRTGLGYVTWNIGPVHGETAKGDTVDYATRIALRNDDAKRSSPYEDPFGEGGLLLGTRRAGPPTAMTPRTSTIRSVVTRAKPSRAGLDGFC